MVIPTRQRPAELLRALESVRRQSLRPLETIVVIDGEDPPTLRALERHDAQLRVIALATAGGGAHARNRGIAEARGDLVALLDDDDEWLPGKLERQVRALAAPSSTPRLVSSRVFCREEGRVEILPRRAPGPDEPLGDYLFVIDPRDGRSGTAQTSTLIAPRWVFERTPFDPWLRRHQDPDWLLRAAHETGARLELIWEPLVVWHLRAPRRVSDRPDWRHALEFVERRRTLLSPRAYSSFVLTQVARQAREQRDGWAQLRILRRALVDGAPTAADLAWYAARALVPTGWKERARRALRHVSRGASMPRERDHADGPHA